ncbi:hypothetical protein [Paraburkholderia caledonica]|uniref:Uncharacterized protein n=1 Tax=Paraburkholderia caledonica TaxID=134536 RepID=A0AB73I7L0_9BURK|nr:hypothetical protein [Paraburkholderia caledonica]
MKISTEHRDALNEALDETAGYEGDVYVFDVKHIETLRSAVIAMLEDDEQIAAVAPAVDAQPVAWFIADDNGEVYRATGYEHERDQWRAVGHAVLPLYASAQSEGLRKALTEIAEQEHIELMLDPTWAQRVAIAALSKHKAGEKDD